MMIFKVVDVKFKSIRNAGDQTTAGCGVLIKRVFRCLGRRFWRRIVISITSFRFKPRFRPFPAISYHRLKRNFSDSFVTEMRDLEAGHGVDRRPEKGCLTPVSDACETPSGQMTPSTEAEANDTVLLKITMLGDSETGKTSFMVKYVSSLRNDKHLPTAGISCMEKVIRVKGAKIAFNIWDLGGHQQFTDIVPLACQDAAAILIVFDLTRGSTLNSVMDWYRQARRWNQMALPVLIGTKFDQFINLPPDIQLTVVKQATAYAEAMEGMLFFSSVTHNINVQKIFKVIIAKLFDLPCNVARNSTLGEPIVYY